MDDVLPAITCLCPTYGRFQRLREALACWQQQQYSGPKFLVILNDAPVPIQDARDGPGASAMQHVLVINREEPWANLGLKRQALLETLAHTDLVAHWDDDDLYLPWHLQRHVTTLQANDAECVKSHGGYYMKGDKRLHVSPEPHHNVFEGTMVFKRKAALERGGYPPRHSGQAFALWKTFQKAGTTRVVLDKDDQAGPVRVSYVYRWADGLGHISAIAKRAAPLKGFHTGNTDFGVDQQFTPAPLTRYAEALRANCGINSGLQ